MAKKQISLGAPQQIAEKLMKLNAAIMGYEAPLKELKAQRDELRDAMLESLKAARINAFATEDGVMYSKALRANYEITDKPKALKWAQEHDCLKVDTARLGKVLLGTGAVPEGFEYVTTEYLATKGVKDALQDNE